MAGQSGTLPCGTSRYALDELSVPLSTKGPQNKAFRSPGVASNKIKRSEHKASNPPR
jgi:hypothetical protein